MNKLVFETHLLEFYIQYLFLRLSDQTKNRVLLLYLAGVARSSLYSIVLKLLQGIVRNDIFGTVQSFFYRRNVAKLSLRSRYFYSKCSDELCFLVSQVQIFTPTTCHVPSTQSNDPHFLLVPNVERNIFFPCITIFWIRMPGGYFPGHFNLNLVNRQL